MPRTPRGGKTGRPPTLSSPTDLPDIGDTRASSMAYIDAVAVLLAAGAVPVSQATAMLECVKTKLRTFRDIAHDRREDARDERKDAEIVELRAMVKRLDTADLEAARRANASRQHMRGTFATGRAESAGRERASQDGCESDANANAGPAAGVATRR